MTSKAPRIGDLISLGLWALFAGAILGTVYSYWPKIVQLLK